MAQKPKIVMGVRKPGAFCMLDPEDQKPLPGARPISRLQETTYQAPQYQQSAQRCKRKGGHNY